ncbi:helix-turn-helix transcriptional regulator [Streptomyces sp. C1-2]|uniref:helix-turn-helix domain-containing protein n=1 Tax=Streptomyces sp. C1-2 TaxID=2720022 RepID=UPI0014327CAF|nr:helix-turn-helix transcriptional regulator [Streptomyces sp. C1-2]NJP73806.1 helix-turn-helix transcriptional regulator [Streptomyces sp. C1-2]
MARYFSGPRLREARKSAGLSPEHLAISVGRSSYSIREYEMGRVTPSVTTLAALADTLGCTVDDLLGEEVANAA